MKIHDIQSVLKDSKIKPETRELVDELINELQRMISENNIDRVCDILSNDRQLYPNIFQDGGIVVIPGNGKGHCAPIVLAITKGRDGRSKYGLLNVMRKVRAYMIQCFEIVEVVIMLTDRWDPDLMKESEADFSAYASRPYGSKIIIPIVGWKNKLTAYSWP